MLMIILLIIAMPHSDGTAASFKIRVNVTINKQYQTFSHQHKHMG